MKRESDIHENDRTITNRVSVPVVELFNQPVDFFSVWPELQSYSGFAEDLLEHSSHAKVVKDTISLLPENTDIQVAVSGGIINEQAAAEFYNSLTYFISNEGTSRIILYLPFEILPLTDWQTEDKRLAESIDRFKKQYLKAWLELLSVHDVRENFISGDVLEEHLRTEDLERVVKAAHLIPAMVQSGILGLDNVVDVYQTTSDHVLKSSVAESLNALTNSQDYDTGDTALSHDDLSWPTTPNRSKWLDFVKQEVEVTQQATKIARGIVNGRLQTKDIMTVLELKTDDKTEDVVVEAIRQLIISYPNVADATFSFYLGVVDNLAQNANPHTNRYIRKLFRHAHSLGLITDDELTKRSIPKTTLEGPLSNNLEFLDMDIERLSEACEIIADDPVLDGCVYPIFTVGGSRLKGYSDDNSDIDISIFIKPGVPEDAQSILQQKILEVLKSVGIEEEPVEFWLDYQDNYLRVKEVEETESVTADKYWTHILFNAAWVGDKTVIRDLQKLLLTPYFSDCSEDRKFYLERLEQDILQYRLMHGGYARHFPPSPNTKNEQPIAIDDGSVFWDSGFRRLATKLFVDMVFIPKLIA